MLIGLRVLQVEIPVWFNVWSLDDVQRLVLWMDVAFIECVRITLAARAQPVAAQHSYFENEKNGILWLLIIWRNDSGFCL